jgi:hypothetical protein
LHEENKLLYPVVYQYFEKSGYKNRRGAEKLERMYARIFVKSMNTI